MPQREVRAARPRSSSTAARIGRALRPLRQRLLPDRGHRACAGTRTTARWIVTHQPRRPRCARASWCMANGPLHRPKLPGIPGIETFKGHTFHTSRWDYDYTGGDAERRPRPGCATSASASSAPAPPPCSACRTWARRAKQLYVFQRTPSSIDVRNNRPTDPEWAQSLEPGWQQQRMDNFNILVSGGYPGGGPGQRRLDRHHPQPACMRCAQAQRRRRRVDDSPQTDASSPTSRRWSRSAPASTRS